MKHLELPETFIIMSFRYALNRNTSAPWEVCQYIKKYWDDICDDFKRQIIDDITREIRLRRDETDYYTKVSDDFIEILAWIERKKTL